MCESHMQNRSHVRFTALILFCSRKGLVIINFLTVNCVKLTQELTVTQTKPNYQTESLTTIKTLYEFFTALNDSC